MTIVYIFTAISGLIGSLIAYDDLRNTADTADKAHQEGDLS